MFETQDERKIFQFSASNTFLLSWKLISENDFRFLHFIVFFFAFAFALPLPWRLKEEWNWLNQFLCGEHACSRISAAILFLFVFSVCFLVCQWSIKCLQKRRNLLSWTQMAWIKLVKFSSLQMRIKLIDEPFFFFFGRVLLVAISTTNIIFLRHKMKLEKFF